MKPIRVEPFRVKERTKVSLASRPTAVAPFYSSKQDLQTRRQELMKDLRKLQRLLYAHDRYSLLVILQALDAAGKDSAIAHIMSGVNPQGCQVFSFKHPSAEELDHDFLWRAAQRLPERGRIGIFNRSYYEDVLIVRVHPEILRAQKVPDELLRGDDLWKHRFESIRDFERHAHRNGTQVVKFFLHLSKDEQRKRFLKRLGHPKKHWKFSVSDVKEREHWDEYQRAYEACLGATSTADAPWYVVPADDKPNAQLLMSTILASRLKGLKMRFPRPAAGGRELAEIRKRLESDS